MKIIVRNRRAAVYGDAIITDNNDYNIDCVFDGDWDGLAAITAIVVRADGAAYEPILLDDDRRFTLPNVTDSAAIYVGFTGGSVKTTTPATIKVDKSILRYAGSDPIPEPETPIYNQIIAKIDSIAAAVSGVDRALDQAVDDLMMGEAALDRKVEAYREEHNRYFDELSEELNGVENDVSGLKQNTYTKQQIDGVIQRLDENIEELDKDIEDLTVEAAKLKTGKADKENVYTKDEVDQKIDDIPVYDDTAIENELAGVKGDFNQYTEKTDGAISDINNTIGDEPASEEMSENVIVALQNMTPLLSNMVSLLLNLPQEDSANALIVEMKKRTDILALILNNMEV